MTKHITGTVTLYMNGQEVGALHDARIVNKEMEFEEPAPLRVVDLRTEGERLTDAAIAKWERERVPF